MFSNIFTLNGEHVVWEGVYGKASNHNTDPKFKGRWRYGGFGDEITEVATETGNKRYNVDITVPGTYIELKGIVRKR